MYPRRVLIVNARSLLMEIVKHLLDSNGNRNLDVIHTLATSLPQLMADVQEKKPGVIVIDETTSFVEPANLIASLLDVQNVRVIALNSQTNKMDVYDKCEFIISQPSHFIDALNYEAKPS